MKKLYIVKNQRDFERIINKGNIKKSKYFILYFENNNLQYDRFGISVGKKLGNAVFRNKYKRKIRAIIDNYKKNYINNKDCIIILKRSGINCKFEELNDDFITLMNKIRKENINETKKEI